MLIRIETLQDEPEKSDDVPLVSVCVQGGPGSVGTVLAAVQQNIPSLLVRGSGKAADLIADAVVLKHVTDLPPNVREQALLLELLVALGMLGTTCRLASAFHPSSIPRTIPPLDWWYLKGLTITVTHHTRQGSSNRMV